MKQSLVRRSSINTQIKIALLGAISFILMYFDFPLPFFPTFLKIDLSDIPALIGTFALGPVAGIIIEFIKNLLYTLIKGSASGFIGEFANFSIGAVWMIVAGVIYKQNKSRKNAVIALAAGFVAMSVFASLLNYFLLIPMYSRLFHMNFGNISVLIATAILPFNLIKGGIVSLGTLALYKKMSPLIHREALIESREEISR
ncbi:riboflavin transporter [Clostridium polyendosporum]|uniref:Riboflavin transporter n=1 Tax=Clostridium polyendosporum TaxID=69208 RepID=A0A919RZG2_9CLOT|nr:ECF transporter S component [Clostridium polyendosporum]GIM29166.1 riboflavin transporter [Clostridium polyendosporum]